MGKAVIHMLRLYPPDQLDVRTTQDGIFLKVQVQAMTASPQLLSNSIYLLLRKLVASEQLYIYIFI